MRPRGWTRLWDFRTSLSSCLSSSTNYLSMALTSSTNTTNFNVSQGKFLSVFKLKWLQNQPQKHYYILDFPVHTASNSLLLHSLEIFWLCATSRPRCLL